MTFSRFLLAMALASVAALSCNKPDVLIAEPKDGDVDLHSIFGDSIPEVIDIIQPKDPLIRNLYGRERQVVDTAFVVDAMQDPLIPNDSMKL